MKVSVIMPTYNERENIELVIQEIDKALRKDYELVIVDDNSPDGTFQIAQGLTNNYPIKLLKREKKLGLASAIVYGFNHANGEILAVIDGDLQHPPEYIKELTAAIEEGYDLAIASRYIDGGSVTGWSSFRKLISKGATLLVKPLIGVKDPMSGYFCLRRQVIEGINFSATGFKILPEILVKGEYKGVREVPYTFVIRSKGESKFGSKVVASYVKLLAHLYWHRIRGQR